jgi:flagellar assembly factor FliW
MKIHSTQFGDQEIDRDSLLSFPLGMSGFESHRQYKLFHEEGKPTVFWLQSLDDADLMFSAAAPELFNIAYEFALTDAEAAALQLEDAADAVVLVLLSRPGEGAPSSEVLPVHAHLKGPLVVNPKKRLAIQKVMHSLERHTLLREV